MDTTISEERRRIRRAPGQGRKRAFSTADRERLARYKDEIAKDQAQESEATQAILRQGRNLAEIRSRRLYLVDGPAPFYAWAKEHVGYEPNQVRKYIRVGAAIAPAEVAGRRLSLNALEQLCRLPASERAAVLAPLGTRVTARALRQAREPNLQDCFSQIEKLLARQERLVGKLGTRLAAGEALADGAIAGLVRRQAEAQASFVGLAEKASPDRGRPDAERPGGGWEPSVVREPVPAIAHAQEDEHEHEEDPVTAALLALRDREEPQPSRRLHAPLASVAAPPPRSSQLRIYGSLTALLDENTRAALAQEAVEASLSSGAAAPSPPAELPMPPADDGEEYTPVPPPPGPARERPSRFSDPDYPYPILQTAAVCGDGDLSNFGLLGLRYKRWEPLALSYSAPFAVGFLGVPGSGKTYALGTVIEGALQEHRCLNRLQDPLCVLSLHYHPAASYEPELLEAVKENSNDKDAEVLMHVYRALPAGLRDVVVLTLPERVAEMRARHPHSQVHGIRFALRELGTDGLRILLGLSDEPAPHYAQQMEGLLRELPGVLTWNRLLEAIAAFPFERRVRRLLVERLARVRPWIDDRYELRDFLRPGRLIQLDLRGDWIPKEQAMTLFALCVRVLALHGAARKEGAPRLLVCYDEAHKFAKVPILRQQMETLVRERRHLDTSVAVSSQDPQSLPQEILSLLDAIGVFHHESADWMRHLGRANAAFARLPVAATAALKPGLMWFWARRWQHIRTDWEQPEGPILIATRPRASQHGG